MFIKFIDASKETFTYLQNLNGKPVPTDYKEIDNEIGGISPKEYWIIGADSRIGKTTFLLNLLWRWALKGKKIYYLSTEMPRERITERLFSIASNVKTKDLRNKVINLSNLQIVIDEMFGDLNLFLYSGEISLKKIVEICKNPEVKPDFFFIDYLQHLARWGEDENRKISQISEMFRSLSLQEGVSFVVASQITKEGQKDSQRKKRIASFSLRGSSSMLYSADVVFLLERDIWEEKKKNHLILKLDKARYGDCGKIIDLYLDPETGIIQEEEAVEK